jgi:hypothetical protein
MRWHLDGYSGVVFPTLVFCERGIRLEVIFICQLRVIMHYAFELFVFTFIVLIVCLVIMAGKRTKQVIKTITPEKLGTVFLWIIGAVVVFIVGVFMHYYFHFNVDSNSDQQNWGTFGDYIGGTLNPILSFLSLMALLGTIVLQSKELKLTRKELKQTRQELSRSAKAQKATKEILDKQSETLERQQFESTFFSLLDQHNKMLENLNKPRGNGQQNFGTNLDLIKNYAFNPHIPDLGTAKLALEQQNAVCGHYFRVLYQLLKFIAINAPGSVIDEAFKEDDIQSSVVTPNEKMYSNIVRSFLGYDITQLLAINCFCANSNDSYWKYKLLIERYGFFEHMPFEVRGKETPLLIKTTSAYEESAFGESEFLRQLKESGRIVTRQEENPLKSDD